MKKKIGAAILNFKCVGSSVSVHVRCSLTWNVLVESALKHNLVVLDVDVNRFDQLA